MSEPSIVASKSHVERLLREADTICRGDRAKVFGLLLQSLAMHIGGSEGWDPLLAMAIEMLTNTRREAQALFGSVKA